MRIIIDNADQNDFNELAKLARAGKINTFRMTDDEERPQGKWSKPFERNGKTYHTCNQCQVSSELILLDFFCPNCGADMQIGGAE